MPLNQHDGQLYLQRNPGIKPLAAHLNQICELNNRNLRIGDLLNESKVTNAALKLTIANLKPASSTTKNTMETLNVAAPHDKSKSNPTTRVQGMPMKPRNQRKFYSTTELQRKQRHFARACARIIYEMKRKAVGANQPS